MSTIRNPVGPLPRAVYWRRRLLLLLGLVAVVVVIVLIVVRPGSGGEGAATAPTPSSSPSATGSATPGAVDATTPCATSAIRLTPVTDATSYAEGVNPMVSMLIENTGATPCTYDVGTGAQEYLITSGSDRIWSSKDCQSSPTSSPMVLQPGDPLATTPFAWDRTRSATDTCGGDRPAVTAGGASYHLEVHLGDAVSSDTVQFVLE
ncbi:MAG: hypothetical protein J0G30_04175 [Actinomycetales bacterium]|nr:hypothetical protein [Actinomycetales bacterium]